MADTCPANRYRSRACFGYWCLCKSLIKRCLKRVGSLEEENRRLLVVVADDRLDLIAKLVDSGAAHVGALGPLGEQRRLLRLPMRRLLCRRLPRLFWRLHLPEPASSGL